MSKRRSGSQNKTHRPTFLATARRQPFRFFGNKSMQPISECLGTRCLTGMHRNRIPIV